ncbi:MAG: sugar kinase [Cereibacter sphaeroides]|uniref:Sugar kinase n=1 Tax=Cereibacter sphaeroides TaxID=1063 RepID=A0A2W5S4M9_CERSP|nr:MAG: sugar kinase [Cereibacter sphaeroides]
MRAYNERLVLSLVRRDGALAKSDIARITGLSAQTVSVIMRGLEADGLLLRGEPIRGRIGQPSVPMSLAGDGAFFYGLKIGRRSVDLVLINLLGQPVGFRRQTYRYPTPDTVIRFVEDALPALSDLLAPEMRGRIGGMGIAMPFQLWSWAQYIEAPAGGLDSWRNRDVAAELSALCDMPVYVQNDATAACGAELVFGKGDRPQDFLYFYIAFFIGGGLVLNGRLFTGKTGNAAGVASMPVPGPGGVMHQLMAVASLSTLTDAMTEAGEVSDAIYEHPDGWIVSPDLLEGWIQTAAKGLASAALSAATLVEIDTVMIDGWLSPAIRTRLVEATGAALRKLDLSGVTPPAIREGTVGPQARELGGAVIPLSQRFLVDQSAMLKS